MADRAVLSQREIDALLNADGSEPEIHPVVTGPTPAPRKDVAHRIKLYDFRHPEKLSKEQLRGLHVMQQGVAGSLAAAFSNRLRSPVESRLSALERGNYEEYVSQVGSSSVVVVIDMAPLAGYAVAAFGLEVAFGVIDRLLGGKGKRYKRGSERDLTDIETALVRHIGMDIATALIEPWGRVVELQPDVVELAVGPQLMHSIPPNEFVLTAWYEVRFGEQAGGISLCFPLTVLEQVLPKLAGQSLLDNRPGRPGETLDKVRDEQILPMKVPLRAILGSATLPAVDVANLSAGDTIVLDREVGEALRLQVGNCERFVGSPGTRGRRMALQISGKVDDDGWVKDFEGAD